MKDIIKKILSCLICVCMIVFVLGKSTDLLERKSSDRKYNTFFEHAEDMDVLFMGTSHVMNAVLPMELWNDYGITSYNFGGHANELATTYWVLENALDYSNPKIVVIDCMNLGSDIKTATTTSLVHLSFDAFPLTWTKIKAAEDLLDDPVRQEKVVDDSGEKLTKIGLLWDYSVYHSRWNEIGKDDFEINAMKEYGAESKIQIAQPAEIIENSGNTLGTETVGIRYLEKMIERCQEKDIEVILTYVPHPITSDGAWTVTNTVYQIAEKYGVNYINFMEENVVDFNTDCYDARSHLNASGAWKVTDYLGNFIKDNYDVADYRADSNYSYWNDDYKIYEEVKINRISNASDLNTHLMLLQDNNYGYVMSVGDVRIFQDQTTLDLLENKGVNISEINEDTKYIFVNGKESAVINSELTGNEWFAENMEDLTIQDSKILVKAFHADEPHNTISSSCFAIPRELGVAERYPNENGLTVLSSKATKVIQ